MRKINEELIYNLELEESLDNKEDVLFICKIKFNAEGEIDADYEALYRVTDLSKVEILEKESNNQYLGRTLTEEEIKNECIK